MSIESMAHTLNLAVGDSTRKLVLIGYANHADKEGRAAFPSLKTVADYACCSVRTVQRHLTVLLAEGYMREGDQGLVARYPHYSRPIVYDVSMSESQRLVWANGGDDSTDGVRDRARVHGARAGEARGRVTAVVDAIEFKSDGAAPDSAPGDNLSPGQIGVPGDKVSPPPGDTDDTPPVTPVTRPGDTHVTQTVLEPPLEPSNYLLPDSGNDGADTSHGHASADAPADEEPFTLIEEISEPAAGATFNEFWAAFPARVGKPAAQKAWDKATLVKGVPGHVIIAGAHAYRAFLDAHPTRKPKWPQGWLNDERWNDDLGDAYVGREDYVRAQYDDVATWGTEAERIAELDARNAQTEEQIEADVQAMFARPVPGRPQSARQHGNNSGW